MIEVRTTATTAPVPQLVPVTSSEEEKATDSSEKVLEVNGESLPVDEVKPEEDNPSHEKTQEAVKEVNQFVQSVQRDLHFSVDEDSGVTVVRVKDKESGELIRQIPEDIFLNLAKDLKETNQIHLLDTHG